MKRIGLKSSKFLIGTLVLMGFVTVINLNAQFEKRMIISGGLSTNQIVGDNWAGLPFLERDTSKPAITGGGFIGSNPGFGLFATFMLDEKGDFRVPLGIQMHFYEGLQRVPYVLYDFEESNHITWDLSHRLSLFTLSLGFHYYIIDFKISQAKLYIGTDLSLNMLTDDVYIEFERNLDRPELSRENGRISKSNATRVGAGIRLGIEGQLDEKWSLNFSSALSAMNLLMREDSRGEFMTSKLDVKSETKENLLYNLNLLILVQYKL